MIVEYNDQMSHYGVTQPIWSQPVSLRDFTEDISDANHCHSTWLYSENYCSHSYHRHVYQVKPSHSHLEMREGLI